MICFSTEKYVSRVHDPVDCYFGRSTVDSQPGQGGALTGAWRGAATKGGSSLRKHLEKEGTEGNLTAVLVGVRAAWFGQATVGQCGGRPSSVGMQYGCEWSKHHARNGKVVWRRCSRVAFTGQGRRKGGGRGVIRRWLGGA
jgi:hypothetical protein